MKGIGDDGIRMSFSENEGEQRNAKRYLMLHSFGSVFKIQYNGVWDLATAWGTSANLMSSTDFKSYTVRFVFIRYSNASD